MPRRLVFLQGFPALYARTAATLTSEPPLRDQGPTASRGARDGGFASRGKTLTPRWLVRRETGPRYWFPDCQFAQRDSELSDLISPSTWADLSTVRYEARRLPKGCLERVWRTAGLRGSRDPHAILLCHIVQRTRPISSVSRRLLATEQRRSRPNRAPCDQRIALALRQRSAPCCLLNFPAQRRAVCGPSAAAGCSASFSPRAAKFNGEAPASGARTSGAGSKLKKASPRWSKVATSSHSKTSLRISRHPSRVRASIAVTSHVRLHGHVRITRAVGAAVRCCDSLCSKLSAKPSFNLFGSRSGTSWMT